MSPHEIDLDELPLFKGRFSFNHKTLQANLTKTLPNYDPCDPRTWPRVTALQIKNRLGHEYDGIRGLPEGVAYDRDIVEKYTQRQQNYEVPVMAVGGAIVKRSHYVKLFPYFYQQGGVMRKTGYMTAAHLIAWMSPLTGKTPETGKKKGFTPINIPPPTKSNTSTKKPAPMPANQKLNPDSGAADIANKILDMHKAEKSSTAGEVKSLKQELADVQGQLSREQQRAEHAEREEVELMNRTMESIAMLHQELDMEKKRADMAEATLCNAPNTHCQELAAVQTELEMERSRAKTLESDNARFKELEQIMRTKAQKELEKEKYKVKWTRCRASVDKKRHDKELADLRGDLEKEKLRADTLEHDMTEIKRLDQEILAKAREELAGANDRADTAETAMANLKKELAHALDKLTKEKARADAASNAEKSCQAELAQERRLRQLVIQQHKFDQERLQDALQRETNDHAATRKELEQFKLRYQQELNRGKELEKQLQLEKKQDSQATQRKMKKLTQDLGAARKEADNSKGELHRVFEEMKKASGSEAQKRKAGGDVLNLAGKKVKTGDADAHCTSNNTEIS